MIKTLSHYNLILLDNIKSQNFSKSISSRLSKVIIIIFFGCLMFLIASIPANEADAKKKKKYEFRLKAATIAPDDSAWDVNISQYLKNVRKNSKGRIGTKYFNSGILGDEVSLVKLAKDNKVQFWGGGLTPFCKYVPELILIELPFLFKNEKQAAFVLNNIKKEVSKMVLKYGFLLADFTRVGWQSIYTARKRITKLEELKGLKMRSQEIKTHMDMWKAFGTEPIPITLNETMNAIQALLIEGFDESPMYALTSTLYKSAKYCTRTEHVYHPAIMVFNAAWINSLPKDMYKAIFDSVENLPAECSKTIKNFEVNIFNIFKESGMEIIEISKEEREKMRKISKPVHKMFLKSTTVDGKKLYDSVTKLIKK